MERFLQNTMNEFFKRTWVQVDLDALKSNYNAIRGHVSPSAKIMAVVKADAYGHGYERVVNEFCGDGCDWFGVSNLEEALQVREVAGGKPILIVGYTPPEYAAQLAVNNISQTVWGMSYAQSLSENARRAGVRVNIHIKADTGMTRLGFPYQDAGLDAGSVDDITAVCALPNLYSEGIFTHFAVADEEKSGEAFTRRQFGLFLDMISRLKQKGIEFEYRHCCNSAATLLYPDMQLDMVRMGIELFGCCPSPKIKKYLEVTPVMSLKTVMSMIKTVRPGTPVSYGGDYVTQRETTVATVPVGYADGYPRALAGGEMLFKGQRLPIIGRICMDQCMLDVTGVDGIAEGSHITVFGKSHRDKISVDELAQRLGTVNYELLCGISKRVPRIYMSHNEIDFITDYIQV
ncbi:MAG: alanine racemase [Oscillospiraceae bacterium]|nr:alanine racemase [Oscillospiraceae bacterium]